MKKKMIFWLFLLPSFTFYFIFFLIPLIGDLALSFTSWNGLDQEIKFIGPQNYIEILTNDSYFYNSLWNTLKYAVLYVVSLNVIALSLAVLFDRKIFLGRFYRAVIFYRTRPV